MQQSAAADHSKPSIPDPLWIRVCEGYVLLIVLFAFVVPFLPKSVRDVFHPASSLGMCLMLPFCFCLAASKPIAASKTTKSRILSGVFFTSVIGVVYIFIRLTP